MKKSLVLILVCAFVLTACGKSGENSNNSGNQTSTESAGSQQSNNSESSVPGKVTDGYYFETSGVKIIPDMEAKDLLDALGEPVSYFEANSCAFGDQDKVWTYGGFTIDTYQLEGIDYIYDVIFTNDTVETPEGIYLGKTHDDVIKAYGTPDEEGETSLLYKKGNMKLIFIIEDEKVKSIEYDSTVLD